MKVLKQKKTFFFHISGSKVSSLPFKAFSASSSPKPGTNLALHLSQDLLNPTGGVKNSSSSPEAGCVSMPVVWFSICSLGAEHFSKKIS